MSRLVDRSRQPRQATAPASAVVADGCWHATPFRLDPDGLKWAPPETEAGAAAVRVKSRQATGTTGIVLLLVTAAIVVAVRPGWLPWIGETGHTFGPRTASPGDRGRHFEPSIRRDSPSALVVAPAPSAPVAPPRVVEPAKPVPPPPVAAAPPPPVEAAPTPAPAAPQPPPAAAVVPRAPVPASSSNIETPPAGSIAPASVAPVATDSAPIKALFGFDSIVGNFASPYTPGSAYVLLHHVFGEVNGKKGLWGHAIGGMGAISQAMAACCRERGVEIRTGVTVKEVIIEQAPTRAGGVVVSETPTAHGVVTENGECIYAKAIISNLNPKLLFERLVGADHQPDDFRERIERYKVGSGTFRMNVALSQLPRFICMPEPGDHLTAGIIIAPSLHYMERAYDDARAYGWSREPIVEMLIPSTLDDSLAPPGQHVASLFCQHVQPVLSGGRSWDDHKDEVADLMIATVDKHAPGFARSVLGRQVLSPLDLERKFALVNGDIMHGALSLDQLFSARPVLGHGDYRTPIKGLYQCGSGTHPGGGVTGAPGHNAARVVARDFRRGRAV